MSFTFTTPDSKVIDFDDFTNCLFSREFTENTRVFLKAVLYTLIGLGFDEDWVLGEFREILEEDMFSSLPPLEFEDCIYPEEL